ncbi:sigma-70 family RNA polymerase sigma factor [Flavobacteriaceae bacterium]|nr:sigma-70 family RNA polymerase sigma factor [Flavobacteriaceae bacterium]
MKSLPSKTLPYLTKKQIIEYYLENYDNLYRYSYSISKSKRIAEDVVQDVFLSLFLRKGLKVHKIHHYLIRAIKFSTLKKAKQSLLKNIIFQCDFDNVTIEAKTYNHSDFLKEKLILDEIERLPKKRREIFKLRRLHMVSTKEISKKLNISEKTVENHLYLAFRQLRPRLTHLI